MDVPSSGTPVVPCCVITELWVGFDDQRCLYGLSNMAGRARRYIRVKIRVLIFFTYYYLTFGRGGKLPLVKDKVQQGFLMVIFSQGAVAKQRGFLWL
jgi:hypothetical protein